MTRPIIAIISPQSVAHNLTLARAYANNAFIWAVIKADAYGHGIEAIYPGLRHADGLAMLDFAEARRVRTLGWRKPILMLEGVFDLGDAELCHTLQLTPVVHTAQQLTLLSQFNKEIQIYVKINSGMNRLGFPLKDLDTLAQTLTQQPHIKVCAWMTHFANADITNGADEQLSHFKTAMDSFFNQYPRLRVPFSLSNSAAILTMPHAMAGSVRAGVMLYGSSPFANRSGAALGLKPTMQLFSQIIAIQDVPKGGAVGYGSTFCAAHPLRIGVVACGYADGYPRHAVTGTPIAVNGVLTRLVGRVSMDMLTVDLTPIPNAQVGHKVELWGGQVSIDSVAAAAGTIGYELMCALARRVPRAIASA
jgi:alanine racemase